MSRTIRRLPIMGRGIKRYASARYVGKTGFLISTEETNLYDAARTLSYYSGIIIDRFSNSYHFETADDIERCNTELHLLWCRKNNTCHRQRKNAVRLCKKAARKTKRARLKEELMREMVGDRAKCS